MKRKASHKARFLSGKSPSSSRARGGLHPLQAVWTVRAKCLLLWYLFPRLPASTWKTVVPTEVSQVGPRPEEEVEMEREQVSKVTGQPGPSLVTSTLSLQRPCLPPPLPLLV